MNQIKIIPAMCIDSLVYGKYAKGKAFEIPK